MLLLLIFYFYHIEIDLSFSLGTKVMMFRYTNFSCDIKDFFQKLSGICLVGCPPKVLRAGISLASWEKEVQNPGDCRGHAYLSLMGQWECDKVTSEDLLQSPAGYSCWAFLGQVTSSLSLRQASGNRVLVYPCSTQKPCLT